VCWGSGSSQSQNSFLRFVESGLLLTRKKQCRDKRLYLFWFLKDINLKTPQLLPKNDTKVDI
jgi:hypothetical protein